MTRIDMYTYERRLSQKFEPRSYLNKTSLPKCPKGALIVWSVLAGYCHHCCYFQFNVICYDWFSSN